MEAKLTGKVAVVTGAGTGIGKAIALRLADLGASLVLLGGRNADNLEKTKAQILALGAPCIVQAGDLTDKTVREAGIRLAAETFGGIDILINNAGAAMHAAFETVTEEQYDALMELDVKVPFFLTQSVLPYLRSSDHATVVNIASVVGHLGYADQSVYAMAKHAVLGFSKTLARELYRENIRVHVISPGGVYTDMVRLSRPDLDGDAMIMPEDIAETVAFLVCNRTNAVIDEIMIHRVGKEPFSV